MWACVQEKWTPGIGDPSVMGWVTVGVYFLAALLAFRNIAIVRGEYRSDALSAGFFWTMMALALIALGINKQLDLQSAFTAAGRCIAVEQGWYDARGTIQRIFIVGVAGSAVALLVGVLALIRTRWRENVVTLIGFTLLLAFIVVRATSFHLMDWLIKYEIGGIKLNWVMELGTLSILIIGILSRPRRAKID